MGPICPDCSMRNVCYHFSVDGVAEREKGEETEREAWGVFQSPKKNSIQQNRKWVYLRSLVNLDYHY